MAESAGLLRHRSLQARCRHPQGERAQFAREDLEGSIPARFQRVASRHPDHLAVLTRDQRLTYRQLNEASERLAQAILRRCGPASEPVAILAQQGTPAAIATLGVLKAGKFFVPLDPNYPTERLDFMLEDSGAPLIVSDRCHVARAGELAQGKLPVLPWDQTAAETPNRERAIPISPDALACIFYSSGTTGRPKGIVYTQRYLLSNVRNYGNAVQIAVQDRWSWLHSYSFSVSGTDLFCPLLHGATCCPWNVADDGLADLGKWLAEAKVTIVHWTPTPFLCFATTLSPESRFPDVRLLMFGSDKLLTRDLPAIHNYFPPDCLFVNRYGATETGLSRMFFFTRETTIPDPVVPVGYAIPEKDVVVLDEQRREVAAGVTGQIAVRSRYLAPGYWRQSDLTREKFVVESVDPTVRTYLTGDLGRMHPDGCLDYIGREDTQVKIRGVRIELREIEAVLAQHPKVRQAAVFLREGPGGDKRLAACVEARQAPAHPTAGELRQHVQGKLPQYMVPSAYLVLDSFPVTLNGKVNRKELETLGFMELSARSDRAAPRNDLERELTEIWQAVLRQDRVGIHDNFFALGGHSLAAVEVMARCTVQLRVALPPNVLFKHPTVAELANRVQMAECGEAQALRDRIPVNSRVDSEQLPLSFAQQRLWFLEQMEGELTAYNLPYALRLRGPLNAEALRRALEAIVRRHEPLRTTFAVVDGGPVQVIRPLERFELPLEDLRALTTEQQAAEIAKRCGAEEERPFDLTRDLMLRASLLRFAENEHVLLVTLHHIASDGWSLHGVFWRELETLYDACCRNADVGLPDLPVQYADYAVWQRKQLEGDRLAGLVQYWRQQLKGVTALELPTDRPRPRQQSYRGARHDFTLGPELIRPLKMLGQAEGVTLHMTLLAAFQALLARYSGLDDVVVGTPIAGRNHPALQGLIGFFVNLLVLRTDLSDDPTFRTLLGRVRQAALDAYDHQDLPFEKLVEELRPERRLSRSPLVQVVFQLLGFSDQGPTLRDLEVARLPQSSERVRFDLEMHVWHPAEKEETLRGTIVYSTDLFDAPTIERLVGHFVALLEGLVADPDQRISNLPLLTEPERQQLLVEWNDTAVEYPRDRCVHHLFEEQAVRTPDAVAVVWEDQETTYGELNRWANRIARYLRRQGIGQGAVGSPGTELEFAL